MCKFQVFTPGFLRLWFCMSWQLVVTHLDAIQICSIDTSGVDFDIILNPLI